MFFSIAPRSLGRTALLVVLAYKVASRKSECEDVPAHPAGAKTGVSLLQVGKRSRETVKVGQHDISSGAQLNGTRPVDPTASHPVVGVHGATEERDAHSDDRAAIQQNSAVDDANIKTDVRPEPDKPPVRTVVINLDTRPDRWTGFLSRWTPLTKFGLLKLHRLRATDAQLDQVPNTLVTEAWGTDRNAKYANYAWYYSGFNLSLTPTERACAMSHVRVWKEIASSGPGLEDTPTLILEDDAVPSADLAERLPVALSEIARVPGGADMVYLGYIIAEPLEDEVAPGLHRAGYLWTTIGYLLWPAGARKLLGALPVDQPVDNFIAWQTKSNGLRAFAVAPQLVKPENAWDVNNDVQHSDEQGSFAMQRIKRFLQTPFQAISRFFGHVVNP